MNVNSTIFSLWGLWDTFISCPKKPSWTARNGLKFCRDTFSGGAGKSYDPFPAIPWELLAGDSKSSTKSFNWAWLGSDSTTKHQWKWKLKKSFQTTKKDLFIEGRYTINHAFRAGAWTTHSPTQHKETSISSVRGAVASLKFQNASRPRYRWCAKSCTSWDGDQDTVV